MMPSDVKNLRSLHSARSLSFLPFGFQATKVTMENSSVFQGILPHQNFLNHKLLASLAFGNVDNVKVWHLLIPATCHGFKDKAELCLIPRL